MRNYSIDSIKFFAAFAVVIIHTQPFRELDGDICQMLYLVIRILCSFAVPFFFTSMGYLFYKKISILENKSTYVVSYLKKICKYLIITVVIYIIYNLLKLLLSSNPLLYIKDFINDITKISNIYYGIDSGGMFHLWYLLIPLYILPIIYLFRNRINLITSIFLILNIIGIFLQIKGVGINVRDALFYGGFYISLGCFVCKYENEIKDKICNISAILLLCILVAFNILQISESILFGRLTYSFSTIFITFILFAIILKNNNILQDSIINKIGSESLGIYLIHPMIIDIAYLAIYRLNMNYISNSIIWQILLTPIVFITSYGVYLIVNNSYSRIVNTLLKSINLHK